MEIMTVLGLLLALGGVVGGNILEGGHVSQLLQSTAFLIVLVGSLGATFVATPTADVVRAFKHLKHCFLPPKLDFKGTMDKILELANLARREGLLALENYASGGKGDPFLAKCLMLAIDGSSAEAIRETVDVDSTIVEEDAKAAAKFWENWGAISPTVGVLGAVLGLMHVMNSLNNPAAIGPGIAVAFVATVYGVGFANIVALPLSFKLKRLSEHSNLMRAMILDGVVGIQSGMAPGALRSKLQVYVGGHQGHGAQGGAGKGRK
jgi:chemotaxis protein MotA